MLRRSSSLLLAAAFLAALTACSGSSDPQEEAVATTATADPSGEVAEPAGESPAAALPTGSPATALPGDEALEPLAPDGAAGDHLVALTALPAGGLTGQLQLTLSGLTAFDEAVQGTCRHDAGTATFASALTDGSRLVVRFGAEGGQVAVTAPGVEVRSVLDGPDVSATGATFAVAGPLVTAGTSETSGTLHLEGVCA